MTIDPRLTEVQDRYRALQEKVAKLEIEMQAYAEILKIFEALDASGEPCARRTNVKAIVIDLLGEAGERGLNAAIALEMGKQRGLRLDRGSVSSLLSRLKRDGAVEYDGNKYRLPSDQKSRTKVYAPTADVTEAA